MLDMTSFIAGARIAKDSRFVVIETTFGSAPMIVIGGRARLILSHETHLSYHASSGAPHAVRKDGEGVGAEATIYVQSSRGW